MTPDFDRFLEDALAGRPRYAADGSRIFLPGGMEVTAADITRAEQRLEVALPDSYKYFLLHCGMGEWCGEVIPHPDALYAFGSNCWAAEGFIGIVRNARGVDDYVALNPADVQAGEEPPVYYCSQAPFGYAKVADSFEHWARRMVKEGRQIYRVLEPAILAKWETYKAGLPESWYQCWW